MLPIFHSLVIHLEGIDAVDLLSELSLCVTAHLLPDMSICLCNCHSLPHLYHIFSSLELCFAVWLFS